MTVRSKSSDEHQGKSSHPRAAVPGASLKATTIPVCEPLLCGQELRYVTDCLKSKWISSKGHYIHEFERRFAQYCGCKHGIATTSGTTALHLALAALGLGPGDEVIVPALTMVSPVFAVIYTRARPVLVDAEPRTWNMDPSRIEEKISPATRAILAVHTYGHPCDMDPIIAIGKAHQLYVVEDAAEAHGAEYKGRKAGSMGDVACFSFYANKVVTTGEGGMVITNNADLAERARALKDMAHSHDRRFLHLEVGFNFRMTNVQAAIGVAQLENIERFVEMRRANAHIYNSCLNSLPGIDLPAEEEWAKNTYWMYSIVVGDEFGVSRDELAALLLERGIETRPFFVPMNQQPFLMDLGLFVGENYPQADELSRRGLNLPSGNGLTRKQIKYVSDVIRHIGK
jgi:perosamine synthetase